MAAAKKTFVGFGFGPIQSALFLYEAYHSGNFDRFVVAEVDEALVGALRHNSGSYSINIAHPDRIQAVDLQGIEAYSPNIPSDRERLLEAVTEADEMATALPSVVFYDKGGAASVVGLLEEGLGRRSAARNSILYAAENNNHAAEILTGHLSDRCKQRLQVLNTVVGKMSGVISDPSTISRLNLKPLTPEGRGSERAVLVEAFNRILVTRVTIEHFGKRGIEVFSEKDDLFPFEEAKLFGHNAIHALIGYLSSLRGLKSMDQAAQHEAIMATARNAFLLESGGALIQKYASLGDPLFTSDGFKTYALDLLARIVNPHLNDLVERVVRDPQRKLGYGDRIFGTMRMALEYGLSPTHLAQGAAAAVRYLRAGKRPENQDELSRILMEVWGPDTDRHARALIELTWQALIQQEPEAHES